MPRPPRGALPGLARRPAARFVATSGYDRALALAAQAFVALVPAVMLAAAYLPSGAGGPQEWLVTRFDLSGEAAAAVRELMQPPPAPATSGIVGGTVLILLTGFGFTRTLHRLHVAAWSLPPLGLRGYLHGLVAVLALVTAVVCSVVLSPSGDRFPATALAVHAALAIILLLPVQWLLLGGRIRLRRLLPGALIMAAGQTVIAALSGPYLRLAIDSQADRFGAIGVAFVLVSWLLLLAYLLVAAAVSGAEIAGAPAPGVPGPPRRLSPPGDRAARTPPGASRPG
ncbi:hypothetical protein [Pseudonocardia sp. NPDC046786]|uniref:hypothetical protein n=1 Tax=Pseudonocardia sp. NPDC046786 TaxID=3155471 RepID=UPI00341128B8